VTASLGARVRRWALEHEGSTRTSALIRIGLVMNVWARFGSEVTPHDQLSLVGRLVAVTFWVVTAMMLVGWCTRAASWITAALLAAFMLGWRALDGNEGWTHHHVELLLIGCALSAITPAGRSYSVDRWLALRRADARGEPPPPEHGNLWGLRLMVLQLCLMYFWAAYDKTHLGFLSGARLEHFFLWYYWGSQGPLWPGLRVMFALAAIGNVLLEYALAFGLPFARTRRWLIWPGLALHATFYLLLPVTVYSSTVMVLYLAYLDPDRVHAEIDRMSGVRVSPPESSARPPT
jgi:hypothetical protein